MNIEKITSETVDSVIFYDYKKRMIDIDNLFKMSLQTYSIELLSLDITPSYDFSNRTNKRFLLHELIDNYMSLVTWSKYQIVFYKNSTISHKLIDSFTKKMVNVFGISVLECEMDFTRFIGQYEENRSEYVEIVDTFLMTNPAKNFKKIKKFLAKEGLNHLYDQYVNDISKKMNLLMS